MNAFLKYFQNRACLFSVTKQFVFHGKSKMSLSRVKYDHISQPILSGMIIVVVMGDSIRLSQKNVQSYLALSSAQYKWRGS